MMAAKCNCYQLMVVWLVVSFWLLIIEEVSYRLQRLCSQLMVYNFTAVCIWCKGATNITLDAMSCNPVQEPLPGDILAECNKNSVAELSTAEIRAWG